MANIKLMNFEAKEIAFENKIKQAESFELTNRCSYTLGFSRDMTMRGEMTAEILNKNDPQNFYLRIKVVGDFIRDNNDMPQDEIHRTTYRMLFPNVKAMITAISVAAGIPPLFFPDISIDGQSVYMVENPKQ